MKKVDVTKAAAALKDHVMAPIPEAIMLTQNGKPVAVIVPTYGGDEETVSLCFNPEFLAILQRSDRGYLEKGGKTLEQMREKYGIPAKKRPAKVSPKGDVRRNGANTKKSLR